MFKFYMLVFFCNPQTAYIFFFFFFGCCQLSPLVNRQPPDLVAVLLDLCGFKNKTTVPVSLCFDSGATLWMQHHARIFMLHLFQR